MTPGRMKEEVSTKQSFDYDDLAICFVEGSWWQKHCISADACITRLRVEINDIHSINKDEISQLGCEHVTIAR